jgi:hypothetical protein
MTTSFRFVLPLLALVTAAPALAQSPPPGNPIDTLAAALQIDPEPLMQCLGGPDGDGAPPAPPSDNAMAAPAMGGPDGGPPPMFDQAKLLSCAQEQNADLTADDIAGAMPQQPAQ